MSNPIKIAAILAAAENGCIGKDNKMPWHIPADLKRFKARTMGSVIIMGRKTFESIIAYLGKPFPGRTSIVVSRSGFAADGAVTCPDIESAIAKGREIAGLQGLDEIFIGGGAQIYELALPYTDRIYLTKVHIDAEGDTYLSPALWHGWKEVETEDFPADGDIPAYSILTLEK